MYTTQKMYREKYHNKFIHEKRRKENPRNRPLPFVDKKKYF